jgi:hypothetical protein
VVAAFPGRRHRRVPKSRIGGIKSGVTIHPSVHALSIEFGRRLLARVSRVCPMPAMKGMGIGVYAVPLTPVVTRFLLAVRYRAQMRQSLSEAEHDRDQSRSVILALAGFSFAGVLAVSVLDITTQQSFANTVYFLLISFLAYLWALNAQGYAATRFQAEMVTAIIDVGSLSLVLSIVSLINRGAAPRFLSYLATCIWGVDHVFRVSFEWRYLSSLGRKVQ